MKPSAAKGRYLRKITFATTMGPGIQVDANRVRNVVGRRRGVSLPSRSDSDSRRKPPSSDGGFRRAGSARPARGT